MDYVNDYILMVIIFCWEKMELCEQMRDTQFTICHWKILVNNHTHILKQKPLTIISLYGIFYQKRILTELSLVLFNQKLIKQI
ncbi:hypothetical protein BSPWISOXPB_4479 [uncultured Gammaproteobacteria bacterium]|nr:hypothetical protein BSPWISOXPB_4479 [uncultured Gammaproteobacteria bacterium]